MNLNRDSPFLSGPTAASTRSPNISLACAPKVPQLDGLAAYKEAARDDGASRQGSLL